MLFCANEAAGELLSIHFISLGLPPAPNAEFLFEKFEL